MKEGLQRLVAVAGAMLYFVSVGVAQSEPQYKELPNFHQVNERLYRGAQPKRGGRKPGRRSGDITSSGRTSLMWRSGFRCRPLSGACRRSPFRRTVRDRPFKLLEDLKCP